MLCLTKYTAIGPSSRYRLLQYRAFLEARGIELDIHPLHTDAYLESRFAGKRTSWGYLLRRFATRLARLSRARRYDLVFIQKELFPYVPGFVESALSAAGVPMVLDIDDAIFLFYRNHPTLSRKIERVISRCSLVLAGNRYLSRYAQQYNPRTVHFPTVVDTSRFIPSKGVSRSVPVVGWIGSPETVGYLREMSPVLDALRERVPFELLLIGATRAGTNDVTVVEKPWSEATEVGHLGDMDVGVMPLPDGDWSRGKCSLKLLQYMSCGVPAVSSPRGSAPDIVVDGENGFLAESPSQWGERLERLLLSREVREAMGRQARRCVEDHYSLSSHGPKLADYLVAVAQGKVVRDEG